MPPPPPENGRTDTDVAVRPPDGTPPAPDPKARLNALLQTEETKLKEDAVAEAVAELQRHRLELIGQLGDAIAEIDAEQDRLERTRSLLISRREELQHCEVPEPAEADLSSARRLKGSVHAAHMELLKYEQARHGSSGRRPAVADLGWAQLARIGFGLTWPLILALLLAAALVTAALVALFGLQN